MWESIHWVCLICNTKQKRRGRETFVRKCVLKPAHSNGPQRNVRPWNPFLIIPSIFLVSRYIFASWHPAFPSLLHLNTYQRSKCRTQTFLQRSQFILCVHQIATLALTWSSGDQNSVAKVRSCMLPESIVLYSQMHCKLNLCNTSDILSTKSSFWASYISMATKLCCKSLGS